MAATPDPAKGSPDLASIETAAAALVMVWSQAEEVAQGHASPSQLRALMTVRHHPGLNLNGLAAELRTIPSSASRLCDRLIAAGLLERKVSADSHREVRLTLRRDGQVLLEDIEKRRREALAAVVDQMTQTGRKALLRGLVEFTELTMSGEARYRQQA